jgi:hypothetical protein
VYEVGGYVSQSSIGYEVDGVEGSRPTCDASRPWPCSRSSEFANNGIASAGEQKSFASTDLQLDFVCETPTK